MTIQVQRYKTCCLILNWNRWQLTLECLDSLRLLTHLPSTLLVCDNSSEDDSSERILDWGHVHFAPSDILYLSPSSKIKKRVDGKIPSFVFIQSPENLGFAGGNNLGLQWALVQNSYDFFWLLNNDTMVDHKALDSLLACSEKNPDVGIWGSTICWPDAPDVVQCAGGCQYFPLTSIFRPIFSGKKRDELQDVEPKRIDYILGASLLARKEVFQKIQLLNEDYFLFYEELDFCLRAQKAGFSLGWCQPSFVYHHGSASIGTAKSADRAQLQKSVYHENLSTLKFTRKHYPWYLPIAMIFRFIGKGFFLIMRRQTYLLPSLLRAYRDFLFKNAG